MTSPWSRWIHYEEKRPRLGQYIQADLICGGCEEYSARLEGFVIDHTDWSNMKAVFINQQICQPALCIQWRTTKDRNYEGKTHSTSTSRHDDDSTPAERNSQSPSEHIPHK